MNFGLARIKRCLALGLLGMGLGWAGAAMGPVAWAGSSTKDLAAGEQTWSLDHLTDLFSRVQTRQVHFEETHYSPLLTEPLTTTGTLTFTAPSKLEKHVLQPFEERYEVDGDILVVQGRQADEARTLSLSEYPPLRVFVEGFRAVLRGDANTIRKFYAPHVKGNRNRWILSLVPLDPDMRSRVESIEFQGREDTIVSIHVREGGGNYSELHITGRGQ